MPEDCGTCHSGSTELKGKIMGIKIKKEPKFEAQKLKPLKVKYTFAVPLIGLLDICTMLSFFMNPATDGILWAKAFYIFFALVGAVFAYWGFTWHLISDNKRIIVRPMLGDEKNVSYGNISKVEVHIKKKRKAMAYYSLHDMSGEQIVRIYSIMTNSGELFNRLKQLGITFEDVVDK